MTQLHRTLIDYATDTIDIQPVWIQTLGAELHKLWHIAAQMATQLEGVLPNCKALEAWEEFNK